MPAYFREVLAFLLFVAVGALIVLQVYGTYGAAPKIVLGAGILAGLFALRYAKIRGAN